MNDFYPFIHKKERKKEEFEPLPLYIELVPPQEKPVEEQEEKRVIIIEIL
jgi:hypothetical protein